MDTSQLTTLNSEVFAFLLSIISKFEIDIIPFRSASEILESPVQSSLTMKPGKKMGKYIVIFSAINDNCKPY